MICLYRDSSNNSMTSCSSSFVLARVFQLTSGQFISPHIMVIFDLGMILRSFGKSLAS